MKCQRRALDGQQQVHRGQIITVLKETESGATTANLSIDDMAPKIREHGARRSELMKARRGAEADMLMQGPTPDLIDRLAECVF